MEEPGRYEALSAGDKPGGRIQWLEGHSRPTLHPRVGAWGTTTKEGHTRDDAWELGPEFLPSVDRSVADQSIGGDILSTRVVFGKVCWW